GPPAYSVPEDPEMGSPSLLGVRMPGVGVGKATDLFLSPSMACLSASASAAISRVRSMPSWYVMVRCASLSLSKPPWMDGLARRLMPSSAACSRRFCACISLVKPVVSAARGLTIVDEDGAARLTPPAGSDSGAAGLRPQAARTSAAKTSPLFRTELELELARDVGGDEGVRARSQARDLADHRRGEVGVLVVGHQEDRLDVFI